MSSTSLGSELTPRLLRIRLLRPPPEQLALDRQRCASLQLALTIADDLGEHFASHGNITLRFEAVDAETFKPLQRAQLTVSSMGTNELTIDASRGTFHACTLSLAFGQRARVPAALALRVSSTSDREAVADDVLTLLGEHALHEDLDGEHFALLSAVSGPVKIGKSESKDKVQTCTRVVHPRHSTDLRIVERPGLNNSTGQRLWDCAVILSAFIMRQDALREMVGGDDLAGKQLKIIELGAGAGLLGICATLAAQQESYKSSSATLTDAEETTTTTLQENLAANASVVQRLPLDAAALEWTDEGVDFDTLVPSSTDNLLLLASDVLYNESSHMPFLDTLMRFFKHAATHEMEAKAVVAYRPRASGDANFFLMADQAGLQAAVLHRWGDISVHKFAMRKGHR